MQIKGILFDMIGTTVVEKNPAVINQCIERAFKQHGVTVPNSLIVANRGKDKREMVVHILNQLNYPQILSTVVFSSFQKNLEKNLNNFELCDGLAEVVDYLKQKRIVLGIGTGLPREIFSKIFRHLKMESLSFDYIGIAEVIGKGRPHPDMIFDMMKVHSLLPHEFLKVGDTMADIQEGKNAQVLTAAMLSGTQSEREILGSNPDFIVHSLAQLKEIIEALGR